MSIPRSNAKGVVTPGVGNGQYCGLELSARRAVYLDHSQSRCAESPSPVNDHLAGVPSSQLMAYATWNVLPNVSVTPNIQLNDRTFNLSSNTNAFLNKRCVLSVAKADWQNHQYD